ncbi:isocitrate lyase [Desulfococcus sp.]|jgi:isocitrate lyase|uniref:Isocitrate lyase n=2 Tax=Desulfococcus multivorans TaxID=897 RepID=S7TX52_DESML|nr:isocitrate lyase [Desulfococcus multivorans]AOY60425.1 AceA: isocitrate lyase [Desulfococcus multivorans]AQV03131.2 isocitrate lyase [Desulfococcus multivorans]EPR41641.1 isocitrate lyase [Desulfococcus multivorans DSM 2059]MDX9817795.1 isocitrate lyase [Desulfococcus multivorans]SJZ61290.1 isocitrate lyase [Desulfococcus multivorans DSM 2059]
MRTIEEKAMELEKRHTCHEIDFAEIEALENRWKNDPRWAGIVRPYKAAEVLNLRGTLGIEHTFARIGAERLWHLLQTEPFVAALGALTGNQAVQQVEAGLKAIYLSGWQVAADNNLAGEMYPDQSLYPANSVPTVVRRINNALRRADQIQVLDCRKDGPYWFAPIVADAEAGFGGPLNAYELMKDMIDAGAAGVHFEDQLSSAKKCGHMGGKVLVPTREFIIKLIAARLAADVCDVPTVLIARTDADAAKLLTSDIDERDRPFIIGNERSSEGFYWVKGGVEAAIARGLSYAPYADMIWCETSRPDLEQARRFAEGIHAEFPGKLLCYNCSPSFNWKANLDEGVIAGFQRELAAMGYKFQFVTLAGFHTLNLGMFDLAQSYKREGMAAYSRFQQEEFRHERSEGYMAVSHQRFVGAGYFDRLMDSVTQGESSVAALKGSTEEEQF